MTKRDFMMMLRIAEFFVLAGVCIGLVIATVISLIADPFEWAYPLAYLVGAFFCLVGISTWKPYE